MYLSRLRLMKSRIALGWIANPYRVHQRLMMACEGDQRMLFRIEDTSEGMQIIVQSHGEPDWSAAFGDFTVLHSQPEYKLFNIEFRSQFRYRFRLLANPTVVKTRDETNGKKKKARLGLFRKEDQLAWLKRKMETAGAKLVGCIASPGGLQRSVKNPAKNIGMQTHFAVLFEGVLQVQSPVQLKEALENGIGPGKGYGLGLLSLAPAWETTLVSS